MRNGRVRPYALITATMAFGTAAPAAAARQDVQAWPGLFVSAPLGHGFLASFEGIDRIVDDASRQGQIELRFQAGHAIAKHLTLWAGYIHFTTFSPAARDVQEEQALEQLNWDAGAIGPVGVTLRTRLEQRFISNDDRTNWRLRQQVRFVLPVTKRGLKLVLWGEPFVALNQTRVVNTRFEQLRVFAGATVPLNPRLSIEAGYLMQYLHRRPGDLVNHSFPITLSLRF